MSKFLKQGSGRGAGVSADHIPSGDDVKLQEWFPALSEYLWLTIGDDGKPRQRATLLIFYEDGLCKACLNDRQEGRTLWRSGGSLTETMEALDEALQLGGGDWRYANGGKTKR